MCEIQSFCQPLWRTLGVCMHHGYSQSCLWKRTLTSWHQFHSHIIHPEPGTETVIYTQIPANKTIVGTSRVCTYLSWPHSQQSPDLLQYARAEKNKRDEQSSTVFGNVTMHLSQSGNGTIIIPLDPVWEWDHALSQSGNGTMHHRLMSTSVPGRLLSNTVATNCCLLGSSRKREHLQEKDHKQHARVVPQYCMCNLSSPSFVPRLWYTQEE